jgi:dTDP-4-dehydrorhamnose reductase
MRVLVTGATGQVGSEVVSLFHRLGHDVVAPGRDGLDFMQPAQVEQRVRLLGPDWIINCAAYTQVDRAESEREQAFIVNRDSPAALARATAACNARLLHISTDFIFDGRQSRPYREDDAPGPLGVYGQSKREGELAVQDILPDAMLLRTAWVYGVHGHNFVKTMLRLAGEGRPLRVVDDQTGSPTWARDIAGAIAGLLQAGAAGVYHYSNAGSVSWCGFAAAILEEAARAGFDIQTRTVEPITTADYPTPARRPVYSVLDTGKIRAELGLVIPAWRDSLVNMLGELHTCETS